ncbi:MAG TPA: hypothetical protein VKD71_15110 [Gemmataceae bacterium]|nr:hypothetical protein [Gemmataceae bacterium]
MKRWTHSVVRTAAIVCLIAIPRATAEPTAPGGGKVIAAPPMPAGKLGTYLGEYLKIEGVRAEFGKVGKQTLIVDTVGGKKLDKPIHMWVQNLELPAKKRCVLKGYELGEMIGTPPAAIAAAKEQGRTDVGESQAAWQWRPYFVVLIAVEPKGLEVREK